MGCLEIVLSAIMAISTNLTEGKAKTFSKAICTESIKKDIDPLIVVAIIKHESNFRILKRKNRNGSYDYGVMQFNCNDEQYSRYLPWRRYYCNPKRRSHLMTIRGGIRAGLKQLSFWKELNIKRYNNLYILNTYINYYNVINNDLSVCRDCSEVSASIYKNLKLKENIKNILKRHWWVRHYNWNSKIHWLSILYIYRILLERSEANYVLIRTDFYRKLSKNKQIFRQCIGSDDLCLWRYKKWLEKRQKRSSKLLREKQST